MLMQLGASAGVTVVLDCGGADVDVDPELLKHLTIISPNESELANLTGMASSPDTATKQNPMLICYLSRSYSALHQDHAEVFCSHTSTEPAGDQP